MQKSIRKIVVMIALGGVLFAAIFVLPEINNTNSMTIYAADGLDQCVVAPKTFPYNTIYPFGLSSVAPDQRLAVSMLRTEWANWKRDRLTSSGAGGFLRVRRSQYEGDDTISESMGYGMILAVYFGEQNLFDNLYSYVKLHMNNNGLMDWQLDPNGNVTPDGDCAATDGDEDIAVSLVFAAKKWRFNPKFNYTKEAKTYIGNIWDHCVEPGTYVLKPGDLWGGSDCTDPSYFAPAWYRIFASFTGNHKWYLVIDKCYSIVKKAQSYSGGAGLVPDFCQADGTADRNYGPRCYDYFYDATRWQWRTAIDYCWFGEPRAKAYVTPLFEFWKKIGIQNVTAGYTITGSPLPDWLYHDATFSSTAASSAMVTDDRDTALAFYTDAVNTIESPPYDYFGNTLRMQILLFMTGNFPNLAL